MVRGAAGRLEERYRDRFVRETARRIYFLLALAGRYGEPARLMEDLRAALEARRGNAAGR